MPTTPPSDNKQEHTSYAADATWGDSCEPYYPNGKEAGVALKRIMAKLRAMRADAEDRVGPYDDKESKEFCKRLREFVCANDMGEKTKAFNAAYDAFHALLSVHPELIKMPDMVSVDELKIGEPVFKSNLSFDEIKRNFEMLAPFNSSR